MGARGQLTQQIKDRSKELMGYEINRTELRLMPYVLTVMMNMQRIDPRMVNKDDRDIMAKWKKAKYIEGGAGGLNICKEFWNIICEIVMMGYVDID